MRGEWLDRRGDELLECGCACHGLGGFARPSAEVSACASCVLELYW
jgi:hypothetical protein